MEIINILRLWLISGLTLFGISMVAQPTTSSDSDRARGTRLLSKHLNEILRANLPRYISAKSFRGENGKRATASIMHDGDGDVIVMQEFLVIGPRLPTEDELLSPRGMLDRYLGSKDGFDRGFLNRVILRLGPISLFGAMGNQQRARTMRQVELRLKNREELFDMASMLKETGDLEGCERLMRESNDLYFRRSKF